MSRLLVKVTAVLCFIMLNMSACALIPDTTVYRSKNGIKMVSKVEGEQLCSYGSGKWEPRFWYGVNLGATTPGHQPGELSPTYGDYRRWFAQMEELGVQTVRIYTILPPDFYQALLEHNQVAKNKLWLIQGIWSPEEELISKQNAFLPSISKQFQDEITLAVKAVYGQGEIAPRPGKASGHYNSNVAPYLLAWMLGTEWDPLMVDNSNQLNSDKNSYQGRFFATTSEASPFEAWLAANLDLLATQETPRGWQHPLAFVNWVTADPLPHPDEPFSQEDLVSVDPLHIVPTGEWLAGYYAAYHVYPYYPDSLRYQEEYQDYVNSEGKKDPYEAYLAELIKHHAGMPFIVAEFGVPSSRGMAHRGAMERNQGMHTEKEQGEMNISMFQAMQRAGAAGGILFSWQDEWFKHTWNTMDLEIPAERRAMWLNRLTNEENFGLIAVEPGNTTRVFLDGSLDEWKRIDPAEIVENRQENILKLRTSSDEAYLYLALEKPDNWNWQKEQLFIAFDNQAGGNNFSSDPQIAFKQGAEFLLTINDKDNASLQVCSAYDQHNYMYGQVLKMISRDEQWDKEDNGIFVPWKLCLSRELFLPSSQRRIPFEEIEIGRLHPGNSNPSSPNFNSLADFYTSSNIIEIRIPWMMLGFTDPSSHQAWAYPYREELDCFSSITSPGLNIEALLLNKETSGISADLTLAYNWKNWDRPSYHERKKESYYLLKSFIEIKQSISS